MKSLKQRWQDAIHSPLWWATTIAMVLFIAVASIPSDGHEYAGKKHSIDGTGQCFGWDTVDSTWKICFIDKEHTRCKTIIYAHDTWHESKTYPCPGTGFEITAQNTTDKTAWIDIMKPGTDNDTDPYEIKPNSSRNIPMEYGEFLLCVAVERDDFWRCHITEITPENYYDEDGHKTYWEISE